VARGTGKDLDSVTQAMTKAIGGNIGALSRLGIPLSDATKKSKDANVAFAELSRTFSGQASVYADTFAGRVDILRQRFDEFKESIGAKLIAKLTEILPYVQRFIDVLAGNADTSLSNKVKSVRRGLDGDGAGTDNLANSLKAVGQAFGALYDAIVGSKSGTANERLNAFADALQHVANGINAVARAYGAVDRFSKSPGYQRFLDIVFGPENPTFPTVSGTRAVGGTVRAGGTYLVGEHGPELLAMGSQGGYVTSNGQMGGGTTVINLNGIVDAESARRAIERIIQQSSRRSGAVNWNPVLT
jgi:hypothetical protein